MSQDSWKIVPRQRVAVNAEGRFLAHWDEFVEHRKEARLATSPRSEFESKLQSLGKLMKTQFGYMCTVYIYIYIYKWHVFKITPNFFWPSSDRFDSFDILLICRSRRSWRRPLKWPAIAVKLGRRSWEVEPTGPLQFNEMWMEIWGNYSQVCIFGSYVFFLCVNNSLLGWVYSCRNVDSVIFLSVSRHDLYCSVDIDAFPSLYLSTSQERYKEMAG